MTKIKIIEVVVVLIVVVGVIYWALVLRDKNIKPVNTAKETSTAIEQVVKSPPTVSPSSNPTAGTVPAVNPIKKTNPFKNEYKNPFE